MEQTTTVNSFELLPVPESLRSFARDETNWVLLQTIVRDYALRNLKKEKLQKEEKNDKAEV